MAFPVFDGGSLAEIGFDRTGSRRNPAFSDPDGFVPAFAMRRAGAVTLSGYRTWQSADVTQPDWRVNAMTAPITN